MGITFNADEVFEMAEQIERNAEKFYRQASGHAAGKNIKKTLLSLADMEHKHIETFQEMRKELSGREKGSTVFDPDNEATMYLQSMADMRSYEGRISPTQQLTGNESTEQILNIAINSEKESVVFYSGIRNSVSAKAGKDKVEKIIAEELNHLRVLLDERQKLMRI